MKKILLSLSILGVLSTSVFATTTKTTKSQIIQKEQAILDKFLKKSDNSLGIETGVVDGRNGIKVAVNSVVFGKVLKKNSILIQSARFSYASHNIWSLSTQIGYDTKLFFGLEVSPFLKIKIGQDKGEISTGSSGVLTQNEWIVRNYYGAGLGLSVRTTLLTNSFSALSAYYLTEGGDKKGEFGTTFYIGVAKNSLLSVSYRQNSYKDYKGVSVNSNSSFLVGYNYTF